jgi:peptide/nickel transport system substrate-binding protein
VSDATLTLGLVLEPVSLDFTTQSGAAIPQVLLDNVYETLVRQDQSTGKLVPGLAKSWTVSSDQRTYTFQLRSGVTFSDGSPFTAADAVFSINYVKTRWTVPVSAQMKIVDSATAVSDTELKVVLSRPSNLWLYAMTTRIGAMMSPNGVADLANKALGTGPYTFASWNRGEQITLTRNDHYWGTEPNVKTVVFKYFQDPTAMNNALLTGGIQVITTVQTPQALAQFQNNPKFTVINGTTNGKVMMTINNAAKPLSDVRVRQAINYALDKNAILKTAWAGYGTVIGSHEVPTDPWYVNLGDKYPHDVAKAKQLLAEAGQTNLTLRLAVPPVPYAQAAAPIIVSQLAQAGITVKASNVTFDNWLAKIFAKPYDYDLTIINHVEARDVTTVFDGTPDYYTQYTNPKVAELEKAGDAGTPEELITDFQQVMTILADDAAAAWLWAFPNLMVADVTVHGLPQNAVGEALDVAQLSVG